MRFSLLSTFVLASTLAAITGCGGGASTASTGPTEPTGPAEPAEPAGPACADILPGIDVAASYGTEDYSEAKLARMLEEARALSLERCEADGWDGAVITCYAGAATSEAADACVGMLTEDQLTAFQDAWASRLAPIAQSEP
jgi:hypothetical protein